MSWFDSWLLVHLLLRRESHKQDCGQHNLEEVEVCVSRMSRIHPFCQWTCSSSRGLSFGPNYRLERCGEVADDCDCDLQHSWSWRRRLKVYLVASFDLLSCQVPNYFHC